MEHQSGTQYRGVRVFGPERLERITQALLQLQIIGAAGQLSGDHQPALTILTQERKLTVQLYRAQLLIYPGIQQAEGVAAQLVFKSWRIQSADRAAGPRVCVHVL